VDNRVTIVLLAFLIFGPASKSGAESVLQQIGEFAVPEANQGVQPLFALLVLRSRQGRTSHFARAETGLRGWAFRIRTGESVRELCDWNCLATWAEVGARPPARPGVFAEFER
jgi:hypothetical protein